MSVRVSVSSRSQSSGSGTGHPAGQPRFRKMAKIGEGSFGDVFKAFDNETQSLVAIKVINLEEAEEEIDEIREEITMLQECASPYVTKYITSYTNGPELCMVMEYLGGGSVHDLLEVGPLEEVYVAIITRELLKAIEYLHASGKIHRDIKAANILLSSKGDVKISDFGVTAKLTNTVQKRNTFVGTPFWMAPEVIKQSDYNEKADIWSIGVTVIEMVTGYPPFHDVHPMKALFLIPKSEPPHLDNHPTASKPLQEFVKLCCQKDDAARPSVKQLLQTKFVRGAKKNALLQELIMERQMRAAARNGGQVSKNRSALGGGGGRGAHTTTASGFDEDGMSEMHVEEVGGDEEFGEMDGDGEGDDGSWSFTVRQPSVTAAKAAEKEKEQQQQQQQAATTPTSVTTRPASVTVVHTTSSSSSSSTPSSTLAAPVPPARPPRPTSKNPSPSGSPTSSAPSTTRTAPSTGGGTAADPSAGLSSDAFFNPASRRTSVTDATAGVRPSLSSQTNTIRRPSRYETNTVRGADDDEDVSSGSGSSSEDEEDGHGDDVGDGFTTVCRRPSTPDGQKQTVDQNNFFDPPKNNNSTTAANAPPVPARPSAAVTAAATTATTVPASSDHSTSPAGAPVVPARPGQQQPQQPRSSFSVPSPSLSTALSHSFALLRSDARFSSCPGLNAALDSVRDSLEALDSLDASNSPGKELVRLLAEQLSGGRASARLSGGGFGTVVASRASLPPVPKFDGSSSPASTSTSSSSSTTSAASSPWRSSLKPVSPNPNASGSSPTHAGGMSASPGEGGNSGKPIPVVLSGFSSVKNLWKQKERELQAAAQATSPFKTTPIAENK